jgi:hypothetical protein
VTERFKELAMKLGLSGDIEKLELDPAFMLMYADIWKEQLKKELKYIKLLIETFAGENNNKRIEIHIRQIKDFNLQQAFNTKKFRRALMFDKEDYKSHDFASLFLPQPLNIITESTYRNLCLTKHTYQTFSHSNQSTVDQDALDAVKKAEKKGEGGIKTKGTLCVRSPRVEIIAILISHATR